MDVQRLRELLEAKIPISQIARQLGVSRQTIYTYIHKEGIQYQRHSNITDNHLKDIVTQIKEQHPESGSVLVLGHLREAGLNVQRRKVRKIIQEVDPDGIEKRTKAVKRRNYTVPCPHYLWHMDGNHKLIKWKMVIHGCIDGFTRMITFLKISDNNRASTVKNQFMLAVREFGWPRRVRTDFGGENQHVWNEMISYRGQHSVVLGSSVHNERIERLWRDINQKVTGKFKDLFLQMTEEGLLNPDKDIDLLCLHWVFIPIIQTALSEFAAAHNHHGISTEGGLSPLQIYALKKDLIDLHAEDHISDEENADNPGRHPVIVNQPLPHIPCVVESSFSEPLKRQLQELGKATKLEEGYTLFQSVANSIGTFVTQNGHL